MAIRFGITSDELASMLHSYCKDVTNLSCFAVWAVRGTKMPIREFVAKPSALPCPFRRHGFREES